MKTRVLLFVLLSMFFIVQGQEQLQLKKNNSKKNEVLSFKKGKLLYKDNFDGNLENWVPEIPKSPASVVVIKNKKLVIDVNGGATVWLNKKLSGNIMITYKRKVVMNNGRNDRLSDLNQFWMANDPKKGNLFTRTGEFSQYDSLLMYYVGFGGNSNTTTRFRKYNGNGERILYHDLTDSTHLLQPNRNYSIITIVYNGVIKFFVDGKEFFSFEDASPIKEGYFGFRTTQSRQEIDDLKIYALK
jgi:hypothetical protein